jgi:hypothetical protein
MSARPPLKLNTSDGPAVRLVRRPLAALRARASQLTACFTRAPILATSAPVNSVSAKATGHM